MTSVIFKDLKGKSKFEVLPNVTYSRDTERESSNSWGDADNSGNVGASFKYGINSATTLEATINPDFSQVESDAFQVEVNRRYPNFFTEKRPFFMEGSEAFDFGTIFDGMMVATVHTRRIVDPTWAAKSKWNRGTFQFRGAGGKR